MLKKHNRQNFWKIPESILGKILSIFDSGGVSGLSSDIDASITYTTTAL